MDTPTTTEAPAPETQNEPDPFLAQTMKDLGLLLKDGELQNAPITKDAIAEDASTPFPLVTLGEAAAKQPEEAPPSPVEGAAKKVEEPPAKPADAPAPTEEAIKPIVVKKQNVESLVKDTVDRVMAEKAPPAPAKEQKPPEQKAAPQPDADAAYEASLGEDERADIEFARIAESKMPEKYKDLSKRQVAFYKKLDAYVEKGKKENPDRTFDDSDTELRSFILENKPRVNPHDQLKIVRMQATEDATTSSRAEIAKVTESLKESKRVEDAIPKIEKAAATAAEILQGAFKDPRRAEEIAANTADPRTEEELITEQIIGRAKDFGWEYAVKQDPVHGGIVKAVIDTTARRAAEFSAMIHGVTPFKPENPDHAWLARFVDHQTRVLQSLGPKAMARPGPNGTPLTFLPRDQFVEALGKDPATHQKHWTFDDGQVVAMIIENSRQDIPKLIKSERERLTAAGYRWDKPTTKKEELPKPANPPAPKPAEPPKKQAPKAAPTISPGASQTNGSPQSPGMFTEREAKLLGHPSLV